MAVSVQCGGIIVKPAEWQNTASKLLSVEDPQERGRNIGLNSHNIEAVIEAMREASSILSQSKGFDSQLGRDSAAVHKQVFVAAPPPCVLSLSPTSLCVSSSCLTLFAAFPP